MNISLTAIVSIHNIGIVWQCRLSNHFIEIHIKSDKSSDGQRLFLQGQESELDGPTLNECGIKEKCEIRVLFDGEKTYKELMIELEELEAAGQRLAKENEDLEVEYGQAHGLVDLFASQVQTMLNVYETKQEGPGDLRSQLQSLMQANADLDHEIDSVQHEPEQVSTSRTKISEGDEVEHFASCADATVEELAEKETILSKIN